MPNVSLIISLIAVFAWLNSYITATTFWTLVVILITWDIVFTNVSFKFGFVSRAKHENIKKEYTKMTANCKVLIDALEEARDKLARVDEYYYTVDEMEDLKQKAKIIGQNAVFKAYAYNKSEFQKHLNAFMAREAEKQDRANRQKKKTSSSVNKKGEPIWYKVLGVERNAAYNDVKTAYRNLSKQFHPDVPGGSEEKMKAINVAWAQAEAHFGK